MNPHDKGWFRKYFHYRVRRLRNERGLNWLEMIELAESGYSYLYQLVQPTGLMYGYPVRFVDVAHPRVPEWSEKDKIKVLLAESFLMGGLYYHLEPDLDPRVALDRVVHDVRDFYYQNYTLIPDAPRKGFSFGRKELHPLDEIEQILDRRTNISYDWRNFWTSFFHNSLLFFDLILFAEWMEHPIQLPKDNLREGRLKLRLNVLRVIAAAAHADGKLMPLERDLFNYFLQSARLPAPYKRQANSFWTKGVDLDEFELGESHSWMLRKYYLELALLTVWANRQISEEEHIFLRKLTHQLDLQPQDLEESMVAIRQFVLDHWEQVHYLQIKQNYRIVSERLIQRMRTVVRKNQRMIGEEIQESRELMTLLRQSTSRELSKAEKEKVREQLLDILRAIPALTIFLLPGGTITLPILLRIIPKHVLYPSSFRENEGE